MLHLEKDAAAVWMQGELLTLTHRADSAKEVAVVLAGNYMPLERISGTDVWFLRTTFERLSEGVLSYAAQETASDGSTKSRTDASYIWRGPEAPAAIDIARDLAGTIERHELESAYLDAPRAVTVYVPPLGAPASGPHPVVYMADGESVPVYARAIEPLIQSGHLPPLVVVGVHNGGYRGEVAPDLSDYDASKDLRAAEYLPVLESEHFANHERFFCEEVPAWAEKRFGVAQTREHRFVFGFSNGGRFAATMGVRHPDQFGHTVAFSVAVGSPPTFDAPPELSSCFHFAAGTWEVFLGHTMAFHDALVEQGIQAAVTARVAGHDELMWQEEFAAALLASLALEQGSGKSAHPELRTELLQMVSTDQFLRGKIVDGRATNKLSRAIEATDRYHASRLHEIVDEIGWPTRTRVGADGAHAAWLIAQHAVFNPPLIERCLAAMEPYFGTDEIEGVDYAFLFDRSRGLRREPMRYGMIHSAVIEAEHLIDERRLAAGFVETLAQYRGDPDYVPPTAEAVVERDADLRRAYGESAALAQDAFKAKDFPGAVEAFGRAFRCLGFVQTEDIYVQAVALAQLGTPRGDFRAVQALRSLAARGFVDLERIDAEPAFQRFEDKDTWQEVVEAMRASATAPRSK